MTKKSIIGTHIVIDPGIHHGKPTFRGTRIPVEQVLEQVAMGLSWEAIVAEWRGRVSLDAIAEAVRLANRAFSEHAISYGIEVPLK